MAVRAVIFDFNGTLSDDEPILCEIFMHLFAAHGKPMSAQAYRRGHVDDSLDQLGLLELGHGLISSLELGAAEPIAGLQRRNSVVGTRRREAVRYAAGRVPLAICSGAARAEIEPVVEAAGLAACFETIVSSDDVAHGKPDPEGYAKALAALDVDPADSLVVEDTEAGIAAGRAAGVGRVVALQTTLDPHRLAEADELIDRLDVVVMRRHLF